MSTNHVSEADIRRRFGRSVTNYWSLCLELAVAWVVQYNGGNRIQVVRLDHDMFSQRTVLTSSKEAERL